MAWFDVFPTATGAGVSTKTQSDTLTHTQSLSSEITSSYHALENQIDLTGCHPHRTALWQSVARVNGSRTTQFS